MLTYAGAGAARAACRADSSAGWRGDGGEIAWGAGMLTYADAC